MKRRICCLLLAFAFIFCLSSCTEEKGEDIGTGFDIVTSFYPVYVAAANIIDGAMGVTLTNLTKENSGCLHDYSLTTEDLKMLSGADVFIVSGLGMESFVSKAAEGIPSLCILDCSEGIDNIIEHDGQINPHYWMNIDNAVSQCRAISDKLCELDPQNAEVYRANTNIYVEKLEKLALEAWACVSSLSLRDMVVFHESFDYFAAQFGLDIVSVLSNHDGSAASPKKIADTVEFMREKNIRAVFTEEQFASDALDTVVREVGADVYTLDCVTQGSVGADAKDAYLKALQKNLETLKSALG